MKAFRSLGGLGLLTGLTLLIAACSDDDSSDPGGSAGKAGAPQGGDGSAGDANGGSGAVAAGGGAGETGSSGAGPKPLDAGAFATLVKTANEVLMRHEQAERARMHKSLSIISDTDQRIRVDLDIARDEDDPHALLAAYDDSGELIRQARVMPNFKLTQAAARRFAQSGET